MSGAKSKSNLSVADPLETGREFVRSLRKPTTKWIADEATESSKTFIEQLLGLDLSQDSNKKTEHAASADAQNKHKNVEIFHFQKHKEKAKVHVEAAMNYHGEIVRNRERAARSELSEVKQNIEQIKIELSKLVTSSQVLKMEFAEISVEQSTPNVGEYHINFFEWMLAVIRAAREKVEDSGAWLGTVKGKGAKRGYWGMFKKHGTTFALSGERAVATQVG